MVFLSKKICLEYKKTLPLQCYPEYNLFTLKKLIPIEIDASLCEERSIFLFLFPKKFSRKNGSVDN